MVKYIIKRILSSIPVLLVVSFVIFLIIFLMPGEPSSTILGMDATQDEIEAFNEKLGLNEPFFLRYINWLKKIAVFDLGESFFMTESVSEAILSHLKPTVSLAVFSEFITLLISIPIGVYAAYKRSSIADKFLNIFSLIGLAVPSFALSLLLILVFAVSMKLLPVAGFQPLSSGLTEHLKFLILPATALAIGQSAIMMRMTKSSMIEALAGEYVEALKIKGISEKKIVFVHALKNASITIVTLIGQSFGGLVAGAIVVETVFGIPGIGQLLINSINRRDISMIQGITLFVSFSYVLVNLIVDIIYSLIDPRIREKEFGD